MGEGETTPPEFLTEEVLTDIMDKNGIGTDSTIHIHIRRLIERKYIEKQVQENVTYLIPSKLGLTLVEGYDCIALTKPFLRAKMERELREICDGTRDKSVEISTIIEICSQ